MLNPRVASRYAKSLLDLAIEKGVLEEVYGDMQYLQDVIRQSRDFANMLKSPVVKADAKTKVVKAIAGERVGTMTLSFVNLVIAKAREAVLPEVISAFIAQYKKHKNIHIVKLTTAMPISDAVRDSIIAQVRKTSDMQNIEVQSIIDPAIIGGFVLQAGDKLVDASISYELKAVSREFEKNDFIYKVR